MAELEAVRKIADNLNEPFVNNEAFKIRLQLMRNCVTLMKEKIVKINESFNAKIISKITEEEAKIKNLQPSDAAAKTPEFELYRAFLLSNLIVDPKRYFEGAFLDFYTVPDEAKLVLYLSQFNENAQAQKATIKEMIAKNSNKMEFWRLLLSTKQTVVPDAQQKIETLKNRIQKFETVFMKNFNSEQLKYNQAERIIMLNRDIKDEKYWDAITNSLEQFKKMQQLLSQLTTAVKTAVNRQVGTISTEPQYFVISYFFGFNSLNDQNKAHLPPIIAGEISGIEYDLNKKVNLEAILKYYNEIMSTHPESSPSPQWSLSVVAYTNMGVVLSAYRNVLRGDPFTLNTEIKKQEESKMQGLFAFESTAQQQARERAEARNRKAIWEQRQEDEKKLREREKERERMEKENERERMKLKKRGREEEEEGASKKKVGELGGRKGGKKSKKKLHRKQKKQKSRRNKR
jgi:hypothetical protein